MSYVETEDAYPSLQQILGADYDQSKFSCGASAILPVHGRRAVPRPMPLPDLTGVPSDEDRDLPWHALGLTREGFTPGLSINALLQYLSLIFFPQTSFATPITANFIAIHSEPRTGLPTSKICITVLTTHANLRIHTSFDSSYMPSVGTGAGG